MEFTLLGRKGELGYRKTVVRLMSDKFEFKKLCGPEVGALDIVFVHGLTGDLSASWTCEKTKFSWPLSMGEQNPTISVYSLGYPTNLFESFTKPEMSLAERAIATLDLIATYGIGDRPIIFVCHSLGGLLIKQVFRCANDSSNEDWKKIVTSTKQVTFLSTPHQGSGLANYLKVVGKITLKRTPKNIAILTEANDNLIELNDAFKGIVTQNAINISVYYEKFLTYGVLVVTPQSSDPGTGVTGIAVEANHIDICKPAHSNIPYARALNVRIQKALKEMQPFFDSAFVVDDFGSKPEYDRRDLQTKMIDANREHEYSRANDWQNQFAQKYHQFGLHPSSRRDHDRLLAEVKQRFQLHVYNERICKRASDQDISDALQEKVIDPICAKYKGAISQVIVMQAVYFLTEQCHLSWDCKQ